MLEIQEQSKFVIIVLRIEPQPSHFTIPLILCGDTLILDPSVRIDQ